MVIGQVQKRRRTKREEYLALPHKSLLAAGQRVPLLAHHLLLLILFNIKLFTLKHYLQDIRPTPPPPVQHYQQDIYDKLLHLLGLHLLLQPTLGPRPRDVVAQPKSTVLERLLADHFCARAKILVEVAVGEVALEEDVEESGAIRTHAQDSVLKTSTIAAFLDPLEATKVLDLDDLWQLLWYEAEPTQTAIVPLLPSDLPTLLGEHLQLRVDQGIGALQPPPGCDLHLSGWTDSVCCQAGLEDHLQVNYCCLEDQEDNNLEEHLQGECLETWCQVLHLSLYLLSGWMNNSE